MAEYVDFSQMARAPRPCRFYMSPTGCRNGTGCRFLHMDGTAQQVAMPTMMPPNGPVMMTPNPVYVSQAPSHYAPTESRGIPCRFFNTRGCRNGDRCPYIHASSSHSQGASKSYSEMTEDEKNNDKSRRVRQKLPGLHVLKCGVCNGDFMRVPGGDRDIREVLKEHYEKMFYARDAAHTEYLEQDIFRVDEAHPFVTCPAENCWDTFANVMDMIYHLAEKSDLTKIQPGRESFQHQFCLSAVARLFSWRDTLLYLNIDEFDSDEEKAKTLQSFNVELFQLLNLDNTETREDKEIEDAIDKEMAKEMKKVHLGGKKGKATANSIPSDDEDDFVLCDEDEYGAHGFTDDDVLELAAQGIKPWDPEAHEALAMLKSAH